MNAKTQNLYQVLRFEIYNTDNSLFEEKFPLEKSISNFENQKYGLLQSGVIVPLNNTIKKELGLEDIVEKFKTDDVFIDAKILRNRYVLHTYGQEVPKYEGISRKFLPTLLTNNQKVKDEWMFYTGEAEDPNEILTGTMFKHRNNESLEVGMYLTPLRQLALTNNYEEVLEKRFKLA